MNHYTLANYKLADLTTVDSYASALRYLNKKQAEKDNRKELALIPWVIAMFAVWTIVYSLYYGF